MATTINFPQPTLSSFAAGPRPRPTTSCLVCRRRKVKCDRTHPTCMQCRRHNLPCQYASTVDGRRPVRFVEQKKPPIPQTDADVLAQYNGNGSLPAAPAAAADGSLPATTLASMDGVMEGNRYVGGAFWGLPLHDNNAEKKDIGRVLQAETNSREETPMPAELVSTLLTQLPTRPYCDILVRAFLENIHPVFPLCHAKILQREYQAFWDHFPAVYQPTTFLCLLSAVLYTGSLSMVPQDAAISTSLYNLYQTLIATCNFPSRNTPSLPLLQAYLIFHSHHATDTEPLSSFNFLPPAIRCAQSLGLHTNVTDSSSDPTTNEVRRRVWWHMVYLDVESAICNGLPSMIHPEDHNAPRPTSAEDIPPAMLISMLGRYEWASRMQRWLRRPPTPSENLAFRSNISSLSNRLRMDGSTEAAWARTYLDLQPDRTSCILSRHLLKSRKHPNISPELVACAKSFLADYLRLASGPEFGRFTWFIPGFMLPLHATILLHLHLMHLPILDLAGQDALEIRMLLDDSFRVLGNRVVNGELVSSQLLKKDIVEPTGTPTTLKEKKAYGAKWVYCLLGKLKMKAWKRAGWDLAQGTQNAKFCVLPTGEEMEGCPFEAAENESAKGGAKGNSRPSPLPKREREDDEYSPPGAQYPNGGGYQNGYQTSGGGYQLQSGVGEAKYANGKNGVNGSATYTNGNGTYQYGNATNGYIVNGTNGTTDPRSRAMEAAQPEVTFNWEEWDEMVGHVFST